MLTFFKKKKKYEEIAAVYVVPSFPFRQFYKIREMTNCCCHPFLWNTSHGIYAKFVSLYNGIPEAKTYRGAKKISIFEPFESQLISSSHFLTFIGRNYAMKK